MGKKQKRRSSKTRKPQVREPHARSPSDVTPPVSADAARIFRGMVSANPDRMSFVDRDYIYREVNDAYLSAYQISREEIVGHHVATILGRERFEKSVKPHFDACLGGARVRYQDWFDFGTLGRRFVDVIYNPFIEPDGTVAGVVVTARDLTEAHLADAALQETRARLNLVLATIDDVVWLADWTARKVLFVSPAYARVWGRSVQSLYDDASSWMAAVHPDDQARVRSVFQQVSRGKSFDAEYRIVTPDGTVRWIHDRGFPTCDTQSQAIQAAGVARDISERKRLERELSTERQRVRAFLGNSAVIAWMKDADGRYVLASDNLVRRFPALYRDWQGRTDFDFWPRATAEEFRQNDVKVLDQGSSTEGVEKATEPDGNVSWWWVSKFPFEDEEGRKHVGGIGVDISARIRADEERQKFVSLAEKSQEFIGMADLNLVPFYVNAAGRQMVGLTSLEEACRVRIPDYFFPEDRPFITGEFFPRIEREGHGEVEIRFRHFQTGEPIWMLYNVFKIEDSEGGTAGWATVSRNITERKRAEQARRQLEEKLAHAQRLEAVGNLASGMAHDINSLLMVILGNVDIIRFHLSGQGKPRDPRELSEAVDRVINAVDRGKTLLDKLLTFGRIRTARRDSVDLNRVVGETLKLLQPMLGGNIRVETRLQKDLPRCEADGPQLQQVVMNLLLNARDAMPDGGGLTVTTESTALSEKDAAANADARPGPHIVLTVADTGIGMTAETQKHIFEPFFSTKPVNKGSGLGLSIAHGVVKHAGGFIAVQSEVGAGTTFRVFLPLSA